MSSTPFQPNRGRSLRPAPTLGTPPRRGVGRRAPGLPLDSLAHALLGAARVALAVRAGQSMTAALQQLLAEVATPQARGAIQDLAYRAMRQRGMADALVSRLTAERELDPPLLRELLTVAIALMMASAKSRAKARAVMLAGAASETVQGAAGLAMPAAGVAAGLASVPAAPYAPFTVVDQAVEAAKATPELARVAGLVNAVLRNFVRDPNVHRAVVAELDPAAARNHPAWWVERMRRAWPAVWEEVLQVNDMQAPLTLRVNLARTHPDAMLARLAEAGLAARRIGPSALRLETPVPVERIPGFSEGLMSVQDEAAQRAAPLLDVDDGMRVLDACAAPGGKSGHLLEIADIRLVALDSDATRLARVRENLQRLGVADPARVQYLVGNAAQPAAWWDGEPFQRILADVPCTASGIVRRHPDIRWLRRETDIETLAIAQAAILNALWPLLAPGGKLLYVTCSVFPEESARQAASFAAAHTDAIVLPAPGQLLPVAGDEVDHDGLFFALFEKRT